MTQIIALVIIAAFAAPSSVARGLDRHPQSQNDAPPNVAGTWNMGLQADHVIPTALVLKQDGRKVTGTIALPTQHSGDRVEVTLTGELTASTFKISGAVEHAAQATTIEVTGTLQEERLPRRHGGVPEP